MGCIDIRTGEQLPEDGIVRPEHVAIKCDFNDILSQRRDCIALETEMNERVIHQCKRMLKYNILSNY
jgi:hypothetical protein